MSFWLLMDFTMVLCSTGKWEGSQGSSKGILLNSARSPSREVTRRIPVVYLGVASKTGTKMEPW